MMRCRCSALPVLGALVLGCSADPGASSISTICTLDSCASISVEGDNPEGPGSFHGYADPSLVQDPERPQQIWLAYTWPHIVPGLASGGEQVLLAAASTHLARSEDGGLSFALAADLWPREPMADPEGSGEKGLISSETPSLAWMRRGGALIWYGAHLRYFLRPETGYHPKFGSRRVVRIGAAASPELLAQATEAVLGVSGTAAVYHPDVRLDELAGVPRDRCAMLNNPVLFAEHDTLYLIVECLAFQGTTFEARASSIHVFATTATGAPPSWSWRHAGKLADASLAQELGGDTIQQPEVTRAVDGTLLALLTPAREDPGAAVGTVMNGCSAVELAALDPPQLRRGGDGRVVVRAAISGTDFGACSHDTASVTGIVLHSTTPSGWRLHRSGLRP